MKFEPCGGIAFFSNAILSYVLPVPMASYFTDLLINTMYIIWASNITMASIFIKLLPFSALRK
jgi:hypothetical protein